MGKTLLMSLLPRLPLAQLSRLPRLENMLLSPQSKDQLLTWLTPLMLSLPRLTSLLLLLPLRLESTPNSLPSQLSHSQSQRLLPQQLSQHMLLLLHSIMVTMVVYNGYYPYHAAAYNYAGYHPYAAYGAHPYAFAPYAYVKPAEE